MTLNLFLKLWDERCSTAHQNIPLFNPEQTRKLTQRQREFFAKVFYHIRGHFDRFLWTVGNLAPNEVAKEVVLGNIREEFGESKKSHERLYVDFCEALGVDIFPETLEEEYNLPFVRKFNHCHLQFLIEHRNNWIAIKAAFAAYERLDNKDYDSLLKLAESLGVNKDGLVFFYVHAHVTHFEMASTDLEEMWQKDQGTVQSSFDFILGHQLGMWRKLSDVILNHH